jgi:hypothetical protein
LEEKRFNMEENSIRLKNEGIAINNTMERSKLILLKMDMFNKHQEMKKKNPNMTDDDLDNLFPYPNISFR